MIIHFLVLQNLFCVIFDFPWPKVRVFPTKKDQIYINNTMSHGYHLRTLDLACITSNASNERGY